MNLEEEILRADHKGQAVSVANYIGSDHERFRRLMALFFSRDDRTCQRSSWVVAHCIDSNLQLVEPYLKKMVKNLNNNINDATKRNTVRILQMVDIPEIMWEDCLNHCFKYLESGDEPVAIKVFSMTILYNLSNKIPEIKTELKMLIENQLPFSSAGYKSRGSKILKKLNMETGPTS